MPVAWRSGFEAIDERHVMMPPHAALYATSPIKAMGTIPATPCHTQNAKVMITMTEIHACSSYNIDSGCTMESLM